MDKSTVRYNGLNGIRAFSVIGIALMHILLNGAYRIDSFLCNRVIATFGELVYLFMTVSAFSLCCGYFEKFTEAKITPTQFYKRRFAKILPFFALLCVLDFISAPSVKSAMELFADVTLCFGLLPNANISVIGVGWFIGLIFVFYIAFPFFCFLIENKRRAWLSFAVSIVFSLLCAYYFFDRTHTVNFDYRSNIVYTAPYFFAGGLIYHYRKLLGKVLDKAKYLILLLCFGAGALFIWQGAKLWTMLPLFTLITVYALREKSPVLENKITAFFSRVSMEIYLCHMLFFRILQKVGITHLFASEILSYLFISALTLILATAFSFAVQKIFDKIGSKKPWRKN